MTVTKIEEETRKMIQLQKDKGQVIAAACTTSPDGTSKSWSCLRFIMIISVLLGSIICTYIILATKTYDLFFLKIITLSEDGEIFKMWERPTMENYLYVYPFNYTNYEKALQGLEPPKVEQLGPYVYMEKNMMAFTEFEGVENVTYLYNRTQVFMPHLSKGSTDDLIISPNVVLMAALDIAKSKGMFAQLSISTMARTLDASPFYHLTVGELLWGYDDRFSTSLRRSSAVFGQKVKKYGLLLDRVGVNENAWTIGTGIPNLEDVGDVKAYNGEKNLPYWSTDECNAISGSDGNLFPGLLVEQKRPLDVFSAGVCRKLRLLYEKKVSSDDDVDYTAYRYRLDNETYSDSASYPPNLCYCQPDQCPPKGTIDISPCNDGIKLLMSYPHFLNGDPQLLTDVEGLHPSREDHDVFVDLHPRAGIPLGGRSRFQVSIAVVHSSYFTVYNRMKKGAVLPLGWLDYEVGAVNGGAATLLWNLDYTVPCLKYFLCWLFFSLGFMSVYLLSKLFCASSSCFSKNEKYINSDLASQLEVMIK